MSTEDDEKMRIFQPFDKDVDDGEMRTFGSGAIRDSSTNKLDYEACLSPLVLRRYAEYVKSCRTQPDGKQRADDNWQKGFGLSVWMKSKWRHLVTTWRCYRDPSYGDIEVSLCAEFFNTHGMLHEILASRLNTEPVVPPDLEFNQVAILRCNTVSGLRAHYGNCKNMRDAIEALARCKHDHPKDSFTIELTMKGD